MNERGVALFASLSCHAALLAWAALTQISTASSAAATDPRPHDQVVAPAPAAPPPGRGQDDAALTPQELYQQLLPELERWPAQASRKAVDQLTRFGAAAAPVARQGLAHKSGRVRSASAQALGAVGSAEDVTELMKVLLERRIKADARTVIAAMHRLDPPRTKMLLLGLLASADAGLRKAAHEVLVHEVAAEDVPGLAELLQDREADVREKALDLLQQAHDVELPRRSLALIGDPSPGVARKVLQLLSSNADPLITREIEQAAHSDSDRVTSYALLILAAKEDLGQGELLAPDRLPGLRSDLRSNDPLVRVAACVAWLAVDYRSELAADDAQVSPAVAIPALFELFTSQRYFRDHPAVFPAAGRILHRVLGVDLGDAIPAWKTWWGREGRSLHVLSEVTHVGGDDLAAVEIEWTRRGGAASSVPVVFAGESFLAQPRLQAPGDLAAPPMVLAKAEMASLVAALDQAGAFSGQVAREHPDATTHVEIRLRGGRRELAFQPESSAAGALIEQALRVCLERERWQLYPPAAIGFSAAWHKEYAFWHAPERTPSERASKLAAAIGGCLATLSGERALRALEDLESLGPAVTKTSSLERSILLLIGVQERPNEVVEKAVDLIASTRDPLWFSPLCGVLTTTFGEAAAGLVGKSMVALNQVASSLSHPLPMVRRLAIERAAEEGESVVPILIDALADVDRNVRLAAIRELGRVGSRQAFEHLKLIAGSGKGADRAAAIQAIGGIGGADALALLQDALRADDAALKLAAIAGMAELGTSEAVDALLVELHLESVPNDLRAAALAGLRRIGGEPVRVKMRSLLHGDKPELRADAALLLGHLLDNEATPVLIPLLDQPERRTDARAALTKLFVEDLGEDPFRYEVLAKEGRPFEELYLRATGLSGSLSPAELRGPGAKRDVVVPALIERLMDSRWAVREDADVLLKELLGVHVDPLLKEATREQLQARQRFWHDRAGK